jgi:hypothetical protein
MPDFETRLNRALTASLDVSTDDYIYLPIRNNNNTAVKISHINWGYRYPTGMAGILFGAGELVIALNTTFRRNFSTVVGYDVAYKSNVNSFGHQVIDFSDPLIIPKGLSAVIAVSAPISTAGAGIITAASLFVKGELISNPENLDGFILK